MSLIKACTAGGSEDEDDEDDDEDDEDEDEAEVLFGDDGGVRGFLVLTRELPISRYRPPMPAKTLGRRRSRRARDSSKRSTRATYKQASTQTHTQNSTHRNRQVAG